MAHVSTLNPAPSATQSAKIHGNTAIPAPALFFAALSDTGRIRSLNEDTFGASAACHAFVVCDGMGGAASGEIASAEARDAFLHSLTTSSIARTSPQTRLCEAVRAANQAVYRHAQRSKACRGMGTTLVSMLISAAPEYTRPAALIAHVGDSRCYRLRGGQLEQLTRDHSLIEEQIQAGVITEEEAAYSPIRNIITRAIGTSSSVEVDIAVHPLQPGDLFLLTSDGLTRELTDEQIAFILRKVDGASVAQSDLEAASRTLIDTANAHGGADNITVLLVANP